MTVNRRQNAAFFQKKSIFSMTLKYGDKSSHTQWGRETASNMILYKKFRL